MFPDDEDHDGERGDEGGGAKVAPPLGVRALFRKTVSARRGAGGPNGPAAVEGVVVEVCTECGAPRRDRERSCRFCGGEMHD